MVSVPSRGMGGFLQMGNLVHATTKIWFPSPLEALGVSYKGGKNMGLDMYLFPSPREA